MDSKKPKNKHCEQDDETTKKHKCHCDEKHEDKCEDENCECHCEECEQAEDLKYQTGLEEKVLDYIQVAQQLQADFDNYRKRSEVLIAQARYSGMEDAITKLIPVLDSLASAEKMITDENLKAGFVMIENQLLNAFTSLGVEKIDAVGQKFDPNLHNALAVQHDAEKEDDIILQEYQAGYKLNEKIIRYSQVIVNKKED